MLVPKKYLEKGNKLKNCINFTVNTIVRKKIIKPDTKKLFIGYILFNFIATA
ncbi:hypothetical protein DSOL_2379 [Desulfosporosinus metallidurans]|uniref:Uncharacterized protein n=1 Tax=Desulfosporosinus metallidurans TaxID=1888891 RepID=A0A1Q8QWH7_9FIRM|nr:hypothetical protein DSOL_2379 [Desulfosporosinus metallidurans]